MFKSNLHSHCCFCDGSHPPEAYINEAINLNFHSFGFSSHATLPFDADFCISRNNLVKYFELINSYKLKYQEYLDIYCGLEIDYIPGIINTTYFTNKFPLDYTIGAIHFVGSYEDNTPFTIEGPAEKFKKGFHEIYRSDIEAYVIKYYQLMNSMIENAPPDIIGHIDKVKYQLKDTYFSEQSSWYKRIVFETLEKIAAKNIIVELNTRGFYKKRCDFFPSKWILKKAREFDIKVTLSSDAHTPSEINSGLLEGINILKSIGYEKIVTLKDNIWQDSTI